MKHGIRALSLLLVFLLVAHTPSMAFSPEKLPLDTALSTGLLGSAFEVVIDNVKVSVMDAEPAAIGVSGRMLIGADGARYMASGELTGAIGKAFGYAMCFEDGAYRVRLHNLSSDYTLSEAALDALDPSERPIDFPLVPPMQPKDVLALLAAYERQSSAGGNDLIKCPSYEPTAFRQLGYDQPGSIKRVNVLDANLDLMFYEASLDAKGMDEWDAALRGATPEINAAQQEIDAIMEKYSAPNWLFTTPTPEWELYPDAGTTPAPTPEPTPTPDPELPDGYVKRGEQVEAKIRLWSDEDANNTRSEKELLISKGEGDKRVERRESTVWEQQVDENGCASFTRQITTGKQHRTARDERSEYRDDDGVVRFSLEYDSTSHYEYDNFTSDTRDRSAIGYTIEPDGKHSVRFEGSNLSSYGQKTEMTFEAEGGPAGDDGALVSHMTMGIKINEQTEQDGEDLLVFALSASFDMRVHQTTLPEGSLLPMLELDDDAATLDLGKLSADQKQALESEISTATIIGSGSMMATPGVAKLIADVQSAMTKMYQAMFDRYVPEEAESSLLGSA